MHPKDEEALETIDAMAFSGDALLDPDNRATFREYLRRWLTQVEVMQGLADDDDDLDMEDDDMDGDADEKDT